MTNHSQKSSPKRKGLKNTISTMFNFEFNKTSDEELIKLKSQGYNVDIIENNTIYVKSNNIINDITENIKHNSKDEDKQENKITDPIQNNDDFKSIIPTTVLSKNGYRINKKFITNKTIEEYKKELTVKPMSSDEPDIQSYPLFRETPSELIVPRYYGINKMSKAEKDTLKNILVDIEFKGQLRDFQVEIVNKSLEIMKTRGGGVISVPCGRGKSFYKGTLVLMFDGSIKPIENVKVGELLMGDDSSSRKVKGLGRGQEEMFDITSMKGEKYTVNRSHILSLKYNGIKPIKIKGVKYNKGDIVDISVNDYLKLPKKYHGRKSPLKGFRVSINFPKIDIIVDPYILGCWLSDSKITSIGINKYLRKLNLIQNKHIPKIYKCNSRDIRLSVLAGILDVDGILKGNGRYELILINKNLTNDVIYLCRSLGFACYKTDHKTLYKINIYGNGLETIPVKLQQRKAIVRQKTKDHLVYGFVIHSIGLGNYYGVEINKNRRFLLADFTVTHNTVMALKLACDLSVKTLVIVHKTILQDQWIERTKQFTNARIGIIRQNKIQVKDRDIVIGMMQSISMKEYDPEIFSDFSFVIFDEAHHTPARMFSNALYKAGARYTLGLSATPHRADGLTRVIHWYLGDFIHQEKNNKNKQVVTKIFHFKSNDLLFREKKDGLNLNLM